VPGIAAAQGEGTLLLLVDDHPTNRMILLRQVNLLGYAAELAVNGLEALDKWRSGRFAMVITDCEMPEMDGYELARNIRAAEALGGRERMPILACTAYVVVGEAQKCRAAGMDDYLSKPVDLKALAARLAKWLPLPPAASPVDAALLAEVCSHDPAEEDELLARFRTYNTEDAGNLRRACTRGDLPQVAQLSHRMVGAGRTVGATDFADACAALERAARAADATAVAAGTAAFEREIVRLDTFFALRGALTAAQAP
jgi:CheY-like chemotaxis protein